VPVETSGPRSRWLPVLIFASLTLLALGLRLYRIDAQSLWYDEGNSARIAERSLQLIVEGAAGDIHPPLYYLLLKYWRDVFGESEAALRGLSAVCGALCALFAGLTVRTMGGLSSGALTAFAVAIAPFAVYYGQEARMYSLLALCASISSWALIRPAGGLLPGRRRWVAFALATAAGLWTQYAYPFVMLAQGVWVLVTLTRLDRTDVGRSLLRFATACAVALAGFAVWVPIAWRQLTGWQVATQPYELLPAALDAFRWLTVGRTLPAADATLVVIVVAALALLGLFNLRVAGIARFGLLLLAALPLALLLALNLYRDAYLKFLLVCVAPLFGLAALGVDVIGQWVPGRFRWAAVLLAFPLLAGLMRPSLDNLYFNPAYARDDYRGVHRLITQQPGPDDAVIFIAPNQWEVYTYYQRDDRSLFPLTYRPTSEAVAGAELAQIMRERNRAFVLYYAEREADPNDWYQTWLAQNSAKVHEAWIGNLRLAVYAGAARFQVVPGGPWRFGDITLQRAEIDTARTDGVTAMTLSWRTDTPVGRRLKVFVHVGKDDAPPVAQFDSEPSGGLRPTDSWQPGELVQDRRGVWAQPGTPPGRYGVFVGLYDANSGARVGERVKLGEVEIR
jgi:mannosyltransferase